METLDADELRYLREVQNRVDELRELADDDAGDKDELFLLVDNALSEVKGSLPRYIRDANGSRAIEDLIEVAQPQQLMRLCESALAGQRSRTLEMMKHATGSYVLEKLIRKLFAEDAEVLKPFMDLCEKLNQEELLDLVSNNRGSFVLRALIGCIVGITPEQAVPAIENDSIIETVDLSADKRKALQSICDNVCESQSKVGAIIYQPHVSATLGVLVGCCGRVDDKMVDKLAHLVLGRKFDFLERHATSTSASHLVEAIFYFMPAELIEEIYTSQLRGKLVEVSQHSTANFMLQRLVTRSGEVSGGLVLNLLDELAADLPNLLASRPGVVLALSRACSKAVDEDCRFKFNKAMKTATKETGSILFGVKKQQPGAVGSLIVQNMLQFSNTPISSEIMMARGDDILQMALDNSWSRVLETFLHSRVHDREKKKVIKHLRSHLVELAREPGGSRVVECVYAYAGSTEARRSVMDEIAKHFEELRDNVNGRFVLRKCRIEAYLSRKEEWEDVEKSNQAKKRMFDDLLEADTQPQAEKTKDKASRKQGKRKKPDDGDDKMQEVMTSLGFGGKNAEKPQSLNKSKPETASEGDGVDTILQAIAGAKNETSERDKKSKSKKKKKKSK